MPDSDNTHLGEVPRPSLSRSAISGALKAGESLSEIGRALGRQSTRYLLLVKVAGKDTATVVNAITAQVQTLPAQLRASLTWDRGMELAEHGRFTIATDVAVYFSDPGGSTSDPARPSTTRRPRLCWPRRLRRPTDPTASFWVKPRV